MQTLVVRLKPGDDLKQSIQDIAKDNGVQAGFIITCVGGLKTVVIRMAEATPGKQDVRQYKGGFEIVSLVGTISPDGVHLHISFSDVEGRVLGGHLKGGTIVDPTAELVIGIDDSKRLSRKIDEDTGFKELVVGV